MQVELYHGEGSTGFICPGIGKSFQFKVGFYIRNLEP